MDELTTTEFKLGQPELSALAHFSVYARTPLARAMVRVRLWLYYGALVLGSVVSIVKVVQGNIDVVSFLWIYAVLIVVLTMVRTRFSRKKTAAPDPHDITELTQRVTVGPNGLRQEVDTGVSIVTWRGLSKIGRDKTSIYLVVRDVLAYIVPWRCFANKDDAETYYRRVTEYHRDAADTSPDVDGVSASWTEGRPPDIAYELGRPDLKPVYTYAARTNKALSLKSYIVALVIFVGLTLCVGFATFDSALTGNFLAMLQDVAMLYLGGIVVYSILVTRAHALRFARSTFEIPWQMWVFPTHYVVHGPTERHWQSWASVRKVESDDGYIYFHYRSGLLRIIPFRAFPSTADAEIFFDTVRRYRDETMHETASPADPEVWPPPPRRR